MLIDNMTKDVLFDQHKEDNKQEVHPMPNKLTIIQINSVTSKIWAKTGHPKPIPSSNLYLTGKSTKLVMVESNQTHKV